MMDFLLPQQQLQHPQQREEPQERRPRRQRRRQQRISSTSTSAALLTALLLLTPPAHATTSNLVGCSSTSTPSTLTCPRDSTNGAIQCSISGSSLTGLGVVTINSTLITSPLSWTVGVSTISSSGSSSTGNGENTQSTSRTYLAGMESGFNITKTPFEICALFLADSTAVLSANDNEDNAYADGEAGKYGQPSGMSCTDVISKRCVDDLVEAVRVVANATFSGTDMCERMARSVEGKLPDSCKKGQDDGLVDTWGRISAVDFTYLPPVTNTTTPPSTCQATLPSTNVLTQVAKFQHRGTGFLSGVTPLFTVIMGRRDYTGRLPANESNIAGGWNKDGTKKLDVHLSCLAPVTDEATEKALEEAEAEEVESTSEGVRRGVQWTMLTVVSLGVLWVM